MSRPGNRGWAAFSLVGIALWVGATVLVTVLNDDPADGKPTLLTFAGGGAAFFAVVFGLAWWQTRPRTDPELDALLAELSLDPGAAPRSARAIAGMRRVARVYILLGALVTALGLIAILQEGLGVGSARATLIAMVVIVVAWAAAVPFVLGRARAASRSVLTPLGLTQFGDRMSGERGGRAVSVRITPRGSVTSFEGSSGALPLSGDGILAYAGRGDERRWAGVEASADGERIVVRREGHEGPAWLWDLWLAERLADDAG
jgi:hypothetical protein